MKRTLSLFLAALLLCVALVLTLASCDVVEGLVGDIIPGFGNSCEHIAGDPITDKAATCTEEGSAHTECTLCGETVEELTLEKLPHTVSDWVAAAPATCTTEGLRHKECKDCGAIIEEEKLEKLPHTASDWMIDLSASCTAEGLKHKECKDCGATLEEEKIEKLDHTPSEPVVENEVAATCTEFGSYDLVVYCSAPDCALELSRVPEAIKPSHSYSDGLCTVCGAPEPAVGLIFTSNGDGTCTVSGIGSFDGTVLVIPSVSPDGETVTAIADSAFLNARALTAIHIPEGVVAIGEKAFYNCSSVTYVYIPSSVASIGVSAFTGCSRLETVEISSANAAYKNIDGNHIYTKDGTTLVYYAQGSTAESFAVPLGVKIIGERAFDSAGYIKSVILPEGLEVIGDYAFNTVGSISAMVLPDSVTSIGKYAFYYCTALSSINLPYGIESIGMRAFYYTPITSIYIPTGIIGAGAFMNCSSLTTVRIGDGVTKISTGAFKYCHTLASVTFDVPENWERISIFGENLGAIGALTNPERAAELLYTTYVDNEWSNPTVHMHLASDWIIDTPAGCLTDGEKHVECTVCHKTLKTEVIAAAGSHDYVDRICTACGDVAPSEGLYFRDLGNGECALAGIGSCTDSYIVVPEYSPEGKRVVAVYSEAFKSNTYITYVVLPDSVTEIGAKAFFECTALTGIRLSETLGMIGDEAFGLCTALASIHLGASVEDLGEAILRGCAALAEITVDAENEFFCSDGLALYTVDGKSLIAYAAASSATSYIVPEGVESIFDYAFYSAKSLVSLSLPESLLKIGYQSFAYCDSLLAIGIPDAVIEMGNFAFLECTSLTTLVIGDGLEAIPAAACRGCTSLVTLVIGSGVKLIYVEAFRGCTSLVSLVIPDNVEEIMNRSFEGCTSLSNVKLGSGLVLLSGGAFTDCGGIMETDGGITYIDGWLVDVDSSVSSVAIKAGTTGIADYAFGGCTGLYVVVIPEGVISIGDSAFSGCTSMTKIVLPSTLRYIGEDAFWGCSSLATAALPEGLISIGYQAFYGCTSLTSMVIPMSVEHIGKYVFSGCTALAEVEIVGNPKGTAIPSYAFYCCSALSKVTLGKTVNSIGAYAFYRCTSLTEIALPASLSRIELCAFDGCSALENAYFSNTLGWWYASSANATSGYTLSSSSLAVANTAAKYLKNGYSMVYWNCESAHQHSLTGWITERVPTCGATGYKYMQCTACGEVVYEEILPKLGSHNYVDGSCTLCGTRVPSEGLEFVSSGNGTCYVKSIGGFDGSVLVIPEYSPAGERVVKIGYRAFAGSTITAVVIPDGVTQIDGWAFSGCLSLKQVVLPASIQLIGSGAFNGTTYIERVYIYDIAKWCEVQLVDTAANPIAVGADLYLVGQSGATLVEDLVIPEGVTKIASRAFMQSEIKSVTLPSTLTEIGSYAFSSCYGLSEVIFPNSLGTIRSYAFSNCRCLTTVTLGSGLTAIESDAFTSCNKLVEIVNNSSLTMSQGLTTNGSIAKNAAYIHTGASEIVNEGGFLFLTISGKDYIVGYVGSETELVLPETYNGGMYGIYSYAFNGVSIRTVYIPASVNVIGYAAFYGSSITSAVFENTSGWWYASSLYATSGTALDSATLAQPNLAVTWLTSQYATKYWKNNATHIHALDRVETIAINAATCYASGTYADVSYCSVCGEEYARTTYTVGALGHTEGEWRVAAEPTCSTTGTKMSECIRCHTVMGVEDIPRLEHIPSEWYVDREPTCKKAGERCVSCTLCGVILDYESIPVIDHYVGRTDIKNYVAATCTVDGSYENVSYCGGCSREMSRVIVTVSATGHTEGSWIVDRAATCTADGSMYLACATCGAELERRSIAASHSYVGGICTVCGEHEPLYVRDGNYIYFGEYPQTLKTADVSITSTTDSRGYYLGSDGKYYARVTASSSGSYTFSDGSAVASGSAYYFRVEPLKWRILTEAGGCALILCESIIDSRAYQSSANDNGDDYYTTANGAPSGTYANNYEYSDIRLWLNGEFYSTAFSELARAIIIEVAIDNSVETTKLAGYYATSDKYASANTYDRVFLLSAAEITSSAYGFGEYSLYDALRVRLVSDYSLAKGATMSTYSAYYGAGYWWLRSPDHRSGGAARTIDVVGYAEGRYNVASTDRGVVPALWIRLEDVSEPESDELYTRDGDYIYFGEYPQTLKEETVAVTTVSDSRGYYLGTDGNYYAKVIADPELGSYVFANGTKVTEGKVYYFKVEPIRWKILTTEGNKALILADTVIDAQPYQSDYYYSSGDYYTAANGATDAEYANNYMHSGIRSWLNEQFYATAFTELQQQLILVTTVDNSAESTCSLANRSASADTEDKIFILSRLESYSAAYGLDSDALRLKLWSDYSIALGLSQSGTSSSNHRYGSWWLRSPLYDHSAYAYVVNSYGDNGGQNTVYSISGVVPALWIRLEGNTETYTEGVVYTPSSDGTYYIVSGYNGAESEVKIAPEYNGKPVKEIGEAAFSMNTGLTGVIIPDSVTTIGSYAFSYSALTGVVIPGGVKAIGTEAFSSCLALASVVISEGVESIGDYAFWGCTSLTAITIPDSVKTIGEESFYFCTAVESVTMGSGVTSIGNSAFDRCDSLDTVYYTGTDAQWVGISVGDRNDPLIYAVRYNV